MAIAREAEPVGSLTEVKEFGLDREDLLGIYRHLLTTRGIEERRAHGTRRRACAALPSTCR